MGPALPERAYEGVFTRCSRAGCIRACTALGTRCVPGLSVFASASIVLAASEPGHVARSPSPHLPEPPPVSPGSPLLAVRFSVPRGLQPGTAARSRDGGRRCGRTLFVHFFHVDHAQLPIAHGRLPTAPSPSSVGTVSQLSVRRAHRARPSPGGPFLLAIGRLHDPGDPGSRHPGGGSMTLAIGWILQAGDQPRNLDPSAWRLAPIAPPSRDAGQRAPTPQRRSDRPVRRSGRCSIFSLSLPTSRYRDREA